LDIINTSPHLNNPMKLFFSHLAPSAKAHFLAGRFISGDRSVLFICLKSSEIDDFKQDLLSFSGGKFEIVTYPADVKEQRIIAAKTLSENVKTAVITTFEGLQTKTLSKNNLINSELKFVSGNTYKYSELAAQLSALGYKREKFTEDKNQFSVRGEVVDIWPSSADFPVRLNFEFDTVSTIKTFDPSTQLSSGQYLKEVTVLSLGGADSNISEDTPITNYTNNAEIYFDSPTDYESKFDLLINDPLNKQAKSAGYKTLSAFNGNVKYFLDSIKGFLQENIKVEVFCANIGEQERLTDAFYDIAVNTDNVKFTILPLTKSFYYETGKTLYISSTEVLYKRKPVNFPRITAGRRLEGIWEISAGDYVVHERYGIGKYIGLKKIARDTSVAEYLCIEYLKGDKLYIPPQELKSVKKYIGVEGVRPKLYSMDGAVWERIKSNAREAAAKFAKELLALYAARTKVVRTPLLNETMWEKELKDTFAYDETPDQLKAIEDVADDFKKPYPMERLVCGDVGFGKTEVAIRAAFKVVASGAQACVLVPTTVLAEQHFNTFSGRLAPFPANVCMLSRFQTKTQQKKIIEDVKKGACDIVIGTHRLLQKDIEFKALGLLIIDEEHRFGVAQKEKIKKLKTNVDILMLSATPIPRTLSQAMNGLRDLSVIETPPFGRLPIETAVSAYDINLIKKIIEAELSRSGQVFYVYNEVATILTKEAEIKKLVPYAKTGVIHGQMKAKDIENVMWKFLNLEIDVLIATTIIESGIDIPSVNTMIIEEAENFGLSQLYQLRGRVGRDKQKAFCYLFYSDKNLTEEAEKRLEAISEFSELGSGFRLALKDLEIRGAGGLLSANQHGFVRDVGYDMFAKLLEEESEKIRGGAAKISAPAVTEISLNTAAFINESYIEEDEMRIMFYRRLTEAQTFEELDKIKSELTDRFGALTSEIETLFEIARLRLTANKLGISLISEDENYLYVHFDSGADFKNFDVMKFVKAFPNAEFLNARYAFKLKKGATPPMPYLKNFLAELPKYGVKIKP
jgi:transcription-repair coupling factor (superfamily II helicase)